MAEQVNSELWLDGVEVLPSPNCNHFPDSVKPLTEQIELLVIHCISLPPAQCEQDYQNNYVEQFFCNQLDASEDDYFAQISNLQVSAHLYIKRDGNVIQFVPLNKRAWHAGVSQFNGREACNDFSLGIELQGTDNTEFTEQQYKSLIQITKSIQQLFPRITSDHIVGHQDIAPGRKTDPGSGFDWHKYKSALTK